MKKILQSVGLVTAFAVATGANAQLPDNGIWPGGVVLTDINGTPHDLDTYLDAGVSIIIDAFADWCGPCWSYHTGGTLENVYNSIGMGGTGDVFIIGVESDPSVPESYISNSGTGQGDWTLGGTLLYPLANDDALPGIINLAYYPTLILICPDRTVTEVGQTSQSNWEAAVASCGAPASNANDPRIISNTSASSVQVCGSTTGSTDVSVVIQNYSTSAISGSYDIEVTQGATVVASTTVTLNLAPYAVQNVTVGSVSLSIGSNSFTASITTANDDTSNDDIPVNITLSPATDVEVGSSLGIQIVLDIDSYPSEVGFALREGTPASNDPAAVWSSSNAGNSIAYKNTGSISSSSFSQNYTLNAVGCHYFVTKDTYGDGITYSYPSGHAEINGMTSMSIPGSWGSGDIFGVNFVAGNDSGIEDIAVLNSLTIYPNPAVNMANVQLELNETANVSIQIVNTLGQVVAVEYLGDVSGFQNVELNTSDLEEGMYLVNVKVGDNVITERISVIK